MRPIANYWRMTARWFVSFLANPTRPVLHLSDDILLICSLRLLNVCASVKASLLGSISQKNVMEADCCCHRKRKEQLCKDQRHSTRFPGVHLHTGLLFCFVYVLHVVVLESVFWLWSTGAVANASPAKSLQKATWRKTLFWAQKKNGGEQSNDGLGPISSCSCFIFGFSLNVRQDAGQREWMSERPRVGIL